MNNRIKWTRVVETRLGPAAVELSVWVVPEFITSFTMLRGRIVGPRCEWANTVEVAYPLREQGRNHMRHSPFGETAIWLHGTIPEPNFWSPETPFLYRIILELWSSDSLDQRQEMVRGFHSFRLTAAGARWNEEPIVIRAISCGDRKNYNLRDLRQSGYNTLVVPMSSARHDWAEASRIGFLMIGRVETQQDLDGPFVREVIARFETPQNFSEPFVDYAQPCYLGRLLHWQTHLSEPAFLENMSHPKDLVAVEINRVPDFPLPSTANCIICPESLLPELANISLHKIIKADRPPEQPLPGTIGWLVSMP